jgi:hypothetical protein
MFTTWDDRTPRAMIDRRLYLNGGAATRPSAGRHTNAATRVLESAPLPSAIGPREQEKNYMRRLHTSILCALLVASAGEALANPVFVNGLRFRGGRTDVTGDPSPNGGRLGYFSDLYYDPIREEWWALGDRGPGGGVLDYQTRVQKIALDVDPWTGRISRFRVLQTVKFTDPFGLLSAPDSALEIGRKRALNGLNPLLLMSDAAELGRSFDPEGLVIDPRTGHFLVSDEYGPSLYEFDRKGRLIFVFETPANLVPRRNGAVNYVAVRDDCASPNTCSGRQDNRGFEGLAITPDGKRLFGVLQDPLIEEPPARDGRNGRNVRIVVFDNDRESPSFGTSVAQYAYQLELQSRIRDRILAVPLSTATNTDPRQGRNIGLSAIVALNDEEFLVLERDNRGIGVDNPGGNAIDPATGKIFALGVVGSKRVYKIKVEDTTSDVSGIANLNPTSDGALPAGVVPVSKSSEDTPFIDLAANTLLPNGNQAEKWEGLAIGPRLKHGAYSIVTGNDNDFSVTQLGGALVQFETYVDFAGHYARCPLGETAGCELNGNGVDEGDFTNDLPAGYRLLPGMLHAYRASAPDLAGYVPPKRGRGHHDCEDDRPGGGRR